MTKKAAGGMSVFVVTDVADEKVANILDEKFNMSTTMPDNPKSDYYNSSSARIIDEYKLTSNNSATKLLQKSEMRKVIVIELSYKGFS
mgnify:CR=1 FL=1